MRTAPLCLRLIARPALLLATLTALAAVASAAPSSSTGQAGRHYLLWARASEARIWEMDASGGLIQERTFAWKSRPPGAETWFPRELSFSPDGGPDGGLRLLWSCPELGRSVAWHLDADFARTGETTFQAGNPPLNWYSTDLERKGDGTGRLVWFNGQVGSAVVWGLDAAGNRVSTKAYTPAADPGAWVPVDYSTAPDGTARLVWSYVWNGTGPWGGRSVVWFLDGSDVKIGSQGLVYDPDWYLRTYHFGNDGRLRFLLANDLEGRGRLCTALTDTTTVPTAEGWGPGQCKSFGPEIGWTLRSYTGNVPLDLGVHERAMIERESERLGYPPESFLSPTQIRVGDAILATSQLEGTGEPQILNLDTWPGGRVYLDFPPNASATFMQNVLDACRHWANVAGVSCLAGNLEPRLRIEVTTDLACYATVGLQPGGNNVMIIDSNGGCVPHEMGHALGFVHTHQREDRDDYVEIHPENARSEFRFAFTDRYRVLPFGFGPYDYHSVMHYGPYDFAIPGLNQPTLTRLNGSTDLGGNGFPTPVDQQEMRRLYPGTGTVSPLAEFILPPVDDPPSFFVSSVVIGGTSYTPGLMPPLEPGEDVNMKIVLTNSGRPWTASEGLWVVVKASGPLAIPGFPLFLVDRTVPTGGGFEVEVELWVFSFASPYPARVDISLLNGANQTLAAEPVYLFIGSPGASSTGIAQVPAVVPQASVLPPGAVLPFDVRVHNPGPTPETVRVRGYIGGAHVTDPQASFQLRTLEPGQSESFAFSAVVPGTPGPVRAYGQLYTVGGGAAFTGNESGEVLVKVTPTCGGCTFAGVACGQEGHCLNDPSQGCGQSHVCGSACDAQAEVHFVTVNPDPVPPGAPFTVKARVKNLSAQVNNFSIRSYTDHPGAAPSERWVENTSLHPLEIRDFSFVFTAPAAGTFQAHGQVFCPGAPLPFVGNSSAPVSIDVGGGGGPYTGVVPSSSIASVGPQPAGAGGTISLHARVHNHNSYTTVFYLRPYATSPVFEELPRRSVSIQPHSEFTELIEFPVPNQPGATLDLHFQTEYTVGQALSGASATGVPIGGPNPPPNPLPPPEAICPGPNDGDATGCPLDGAGFQSYRTCQSCRAAYPAAPGCAQKQLLDWCWKPQ